MRSRNQEDYLRAIYCLYEEKKTGVKSSDISKYLEVSRASVSEMLKKLSGKQLVICEPYSLVILTKKGYDESLELTYKHRIIEVFLEDVLKCPDDTIHEEAHALEHAFSLDAVKRLEKLLKNPVICPDGKHIPKFK
ncbi:metal-dependent transcriptional regulator [Patescibacteria group bacterium]|nr:metal-dependent transcriptional regulator [Patescibacteria group bacterium]